MLQGDFGTQKEAAWAISNLTISGRKDQVSLHGYSMVSIGMWVVVVAIASTPKTRLDTQYSTFLFYCSDC